MAATSTAVSVIVALVLLVAVFYFVWYLFSDWSNGAANAPWLIKDTRIARKGAVVPGSIIPFSSDGRFGLEFSYSFWIYVNEWDTPSQTGAMKHIMHKGDSNPTPQFQAPGFWMDANTNRIVFRMNTFNKNQFTEECGLNNIPIGKWVNIVAVVIGKNVDLYVNGNLKNRCSFDGVPMQNYGDIYLTQNGGFDGFLSKFRYYSYALPYWKVEQIMADGPSPAPCTETGTKPPYQAFDYWLQGR